MGDIETASFRSGSDGGTLPFAAYGLPRDRPTRSPRRGGGVPSREPPRLVGGGRFGFDHGKTRRAGCGRRETEAGACH